MKTMSQTQVWRRLAFGAGRGEARAEKQGKNQLIGILPSSCIADGAQWAFGGAAGRVIVGRGALSAIAREVDREFLSVKRGQEGISLPKDKVAAWKKDAAFCEMALAVAIQAPPSMHFGGNVFWGGGEWLRVRKAAQTGDCFIDVGEGRRWKARKTDALQTLSHILDCNFKELLAFLSLLEEALTKRGVIASAAPPATGRFSRLAVVKLQARHGGLQIPTRIGMAIVWLAARGRSFPGGARELAAAALRVSRLTEKSRRSAEYTIKNMPADVVHSLCAGEFKDWGGFCKWQAALFSGLRSGGALAQFRCVFSLWRGCLSREGGGWRWRGFHRQYEGGRGGVALKLSREAGVGKRAAQNAITTCKFLGFLLVHGKSICLSIGIWGKALINNLSFALTTSVGTQNKSITEGLLAKSILFLKQAKLPALT